MAISRITALTDALALPARVARSGPAGREAAAFIPSASFARQRDRDRIRRPTRSHVRKSPANYPGLPPSEPAINDRAFEQICHICNSFGSGQIRMAYLQPVV